MATINIYDLRPTGSDLFSDSEGYMRDLVDSESDYLYGGLPSLLIYAGVLALESSAACASAAGLAIGGVIGYNNA